MLMSRQVVVELWLFEELGALPVMEQNRSKPAPAQPSGANPHNIPIKRKLSVMPTCLLRPNIRKRTILAHHAEDTRHGAESPECPCSPADWPESPQYAY